uniref:Cystatin domain-containing protein n=1 Tax=Eutreptiella gymnastica TaxID=73025 RepID=A0A7S4CA70_9EUGL
MAPGFLREGIHGRLFEVGGDDDLVASQQASRSSYPRMLVMGAFILAVAFVVVLSAQESKKNAVQTHATVGGAPTGRFNGMAGGLGVALPMTDDVAHMVGSLRDQILRLAQSKGLNGDFVVFEPISYRTQVVAGTNYFVKIRIGRDDNDYIHVRIFQPLPYTGEGPEVHSLQMSKTATDDIGYDS